VWREEREGIGDLGLLDPFIGLVGYGDEHTERNAGFKVNPLSD